MKKLAAIRRPGMIFLSLASVTTFFAVVLSPPASATGAWTTVLDEEFNGSALSSNWQVTTGTQYPGGPANFGTGEVEVNTANSENLRVAGGDLLITPVRDDAGHWTSARIETKSVFKPAEGAVMRIEGNIAMPDVTGNAALGYWPAFWALGAPYRQNSWSWPGIGEYDIMENVNGINKSWATLHCGYAPGGPCNENIGRGNGGVGPTGAAFQGHFHDYAFEWDRSGGQGNDDLRWYNDGKLVNQVRESDLPADTWTSMTAHAGYFIILNVAMGGAFPAALGGGPTVDTKSGVPLKVDFVKVSYKGGGSTPSPTPTPTASPTAKPTSTPSPTATSTSTATSTPTASPTPTPSPTPSPTTAPTSADDSQTAVVEAEDFASQFQTSTERSSDVGGGKDVTSINDGSWLCYPTVKFGDKPKSQFVARIASGAPDGVSGIVEVHLDNLQSPVSGSFAFANTGGWQNWRTVPANLDPTSGDHQVCLRFVSGAPGHLVNLNKFVFSTTGTPNL